MFWRFPSNLSFLTNMIPLSLCSFGSLGSFRQCPTSLTRAIGKFFISTFKIHHFCNRTEIVTDFQIVCYLCLSLGITLNLPLLTNSLDRQPTSQLLISRWKNKMTIFTTDATRVWRELVDGSRGSCWRCRRGGARRRPSIFFRYILLSTTKVLLV